MRRRVWLCLACALALWRPLPISASYVAATCHPRVTGAMDAGGPVDGVLPLSRSVAALLVGRRRGAPRFMGHDRLVLVDAHRLQVRQRLDLPAYTAPPGLTVLEGGRDLAVVIDDRLLVLRASSGQVIHRSGLDIAAVGWPAAVAGIGDRLFVAGQPGSSSVPTARLEAFEIGHNGTRVRSLWRANLGLTHAGIWLGVAGHNDLAAYLPDAHDLAGSVATWNVRSGALQASYAVPAPILALDRHLNLLYGSIGARVYARPLGRGATLERSGTEPLAVDSPRGLLLLADGKAIVAASARSLRTMGTVRLSSSRALAVADGGATLFAGVPTGLVRIDLASCRVP